MSAFYSLKAKTPKGEYDFKQLEGKVVLIVNVASKCGLTPQYEGLEKLYKDHKDEGLVILGFPSNQFLSQEPGDDAAIGSFCSLNYGVSFPIMSKSDVNGADTNEVFVYLKKELPGLLGLKRIPWNFTKFLVDANGKPFKRYAPTTNPADIEKDIVSLLAAAKK